MKWIVKIVSVKSMGNGGNHAKLKYVQPQPSPFWGEFIGKVYQTWNLGYGKVIPATNIISQGGNVEKNNQTRNYGREILPN